ncbi:MAG: Gfo/Idh/MocA family oxidoreductase [Ignavibacteriales bacterium]|nr:Gfo/Idh/MocA family oxidoreductase [Ignavibacteriales bacterium]
MENNLKRRDFIKRSAMAGVGIAVSSVALADEIQQKLKSPAKVAPVAKPMEKVRIGYVGVGGQGTDHVSNLLKIKGAEIVAVCDIVEAHAARAQEMIVKAGFKKPELYTKSETDFKRLCQRDDIDLVYSALPWEWHVPVCLEAMNNGKHTATEVPAANTIEDCWKLVETSEKTGKYCIMMENCNYDKTEMMILNMVKKGLFGELLHTECGYLHDLRAVKHDLEGEGLWRRAHAMKRNGDFYPTHGLGPIAQCLDINRGNYFDYLVSFGTKTRGLHLYAEKRFGADSPQAKEKFVLSDVVTTLIKTMNDETILITHDTSSPRPYSRDIYVQGTKGLVRKYPEQKIYIEEEGKPDAWEKIDEYMKKYEHPIWVDLEEKSKGAGHGGMDFIEDYRLVNALLKGVEPDMDVYDAAVISAVCELSEKSIKQKGMPQKFPDFTRGMWKKKRELMVM